MQRGVELPQWWKSMARVALAWPRVGCQVHNTGYLHGKVRSCVPLSLLSDLWVLPEVLHDPRHAMILIILDQVMSFLLSARKSQVLCTPSSSIRPESVAPQAIRCNDPWHEMSLNSNFVSSPILLTFCLHIMFWSKTICVGEGVILRREKVNCIMFFFRNWSRWFC